MEGEKRMILSFWQDKRLTRICHILTKKGYRIGIAGCTLPAGMPKEVTLHPNWRDALHCADAVLLPLPTLRGNFIAFQEEELLFSEFLSFLLPGTVLLGGMIPKDKVKEAEDAGMEVYDYYASEAVMHRNGELTAEGAIAIAMQELPLAMDEVRAAVVGCGRIGQALCRMMRAMKSDVTALARREASLQEARTLGCTTQILDVHALTDLMSGYDVIFTTVPSRIFTEEILMHSKRLSDGRKTLFIDLSSSPGSFDPVAARAYDIRLLWALSLPGKYAPDSAGTVLAEQIEKLLMESNSGDARKEVL